MARGDTQYLETFYRVMADKSNRAERERDRQLQEIIAQTRLTMERRRSEADRMREKLVMAREEVEAARVRRSEKRMDTQLELQGLKVRSEIASDQARTAMQVRMMHSQMINSLIQTQSQMLQALAAVDQAKATKIAASLNAAEMARKLALSNQELIDGYTQQSVAEGALGMGFFGKVNEDGEFEAGIYGNDIIKKSNRSRRTQEDDVTGFLTNFKDTYNDELRNGIMDYYKANGREGTPLHDIANQPAVLASLGDKAMKRSMRRVILEAGFADAKGKTREIIDRAIRSGNYDQAIRYVGVDPGTSTRQFRIWVSDQPLPMEQTAALLENYLTAVSGSYVSHMNRAALAEFSAGSLTSQNNALLTGASLSLFDAGQRIAGGVSGVEPMIGDMLKSMESARQIYDDTFVSHNDPVLGETDAARAMVDLSGMMGNLFKDYTKGPGSTQGGMEASQGQDGQPRTEIRVPPLLDRNAADRGISFPYSTVQPRSPLGNREDALQDALQKAVQDLLKSFPASGNVPVGEMSPEEKMEFNRLWQQGRH